MCQRNFEKWIQRAKRPLQKKKAFIPIFSTLQRTFKFPDPEKYGKTREEFESFKYIFRIKFRASYDW